MPKTHFRSIPHLLSLFPDQNHTNYPSSHASLEAISPHLAQDFANAGPALSASREMMRDMDMMYQNAIGTAPSVHHAYYNILAHHINMALQLIQCATDHAKDTYGAFEDNFKDSPEYKIQHDSYLTGGNRVREQIAAGTRKKTDFPGVERKISGHCNTAFLFTTSNKDKQKAKDELAQIGTCIEGMKEWLHDVAMADTGKSKAMQPQSADFYGAAYRFLEEAQMHRQQWEQQLGRMHIPKPRPDTPRTKPKDFKIDLPVFSLFPHDHPCDFGKSERPIPDILANTISNPPPYESIQHMISNLKDLDAGYMEAINNAQNMDDAYFATIRHHLTSCVGLLALAKTVAKPNSPEHALFDSAHLDDSQGVCISRLDTMLKATTALREKMAQEKLLAKEYGIARPNVLESSDEMAAYNKARGELFMGIEGKIYEMLEYMHAPPANDAPPVGKYTPEIYHTTMDFLLDAQAHLASWQHSIQPVVTTARNTGNTRG